jgi:hypothetical protein
MKSSTAGLFFRQQFAGPSRSFCSRETGEPQEENAVTNMSANSLKVRKRRAGPEDMEIGRKIRALRLERGLSQTGLAEGSGLTFQQV